MNCVYLSSFQKNVRCLIGKRRTDSGEDVQFCDSSHDQFITGR